MFGEIRILLLACWCSIANGQRSFSASNWPTRRPRGGRAGPTATVNYIDTGAKLGVRPFISPDGQIRLEAHSEYTDGRLDPDGIPQTDTVAMTINVMMCDGATVAMARRSMVDIPPDADHFAFLGWVPYLNWIPFLDYLFRETPFSVEEQQIFLFTTYLWKPQEHPLTSIPLAAKL